MPLQLLPEIDCGDPKRRRLELTIPKIPLKSKGIVGYYSSPGASLKGGEIFAEDRRRGPTTHHHGEGSEEPRSGGRCGREGRSRALKHRL